MKKERCKYCTFFTAYYRKEASGLCKSSYGFCKTHSKFINQFKNCEHYKSNEQKEKLQEQLRLEALDQALKSINEISQILKEKQ